MKTLMQEGRRVIVHKEMNGIPIRRNCSCGKIHLLKWKEGNRFIRCTCGRLIRI